MITGLRTKNFKKLTDFSAEFKDGTNLIFGENAEGKSSSFDAIRFALFGVKAIVGTVDSLTTWGRSGMWVELDIAGYTFRRTTSNCKVTDADGELMASGNTASAKFAEKILGCSLKDFDLLYMSKQNETAGLITFGATGLNRKVEEYAGVALIDKVIKKLGSEVHGSQVALESFDFMPVDELNKQLDDIQSEGEAVSGDIERLTAEEADFTTKITEVRLELRNAHAFNTEQDTVAKNNETLERKLTNARARVEASKASLEKAQSAFADSNDVSEEKIEEVSVQLATVRDVSRQLTKLQDEGELVDEIAQAEAKAKEEDRYLLEIPGFEEAVQSATSAYNASQETHNANVRAYRSATNEAKDGICSECKRPLEDHNPEEAEAKKQKAAEAVSASKELLEVAESNLSSANSALRDHHRTNPGSGWSSKSKELRVKLDEVKAQRVELEAKLSGLELEDTLQKQYNCLVSDQKIMKRVRSELKNCESDHEDNLGTLEVLESQGINKPLDRIDTAPIESKANDLINSKAAVSNELATRITRREVLLEKHRSAKNQIASAEANNKKMSELEASLSLAKQLRKYLNDERVKFMEGVWRTILGTASHFINKTTEGWITSVGRNENGAFTFTENGIEAIAEESGSGAQKAFIGTAIKVGLAQAKMGSSSMVLLDEPTADMREDKASRLASGLMMLSGQKIMITHRDSERMVAQNIIHIGE